MLAQLVQLGGHPSQFTVEIVEGALLQDVPAVYENLAVLRRWGCHVALDDFGEGQANIVTFMAFHGLVDTVKIDQKLVRHEDHRGAEALIMLAQSFGKDIVAEGVETQEQADWLAGLGVYTIQGWLFSKALPVDEFQKFAWERGALPVH